MRIFLSMGIVELTGHGIPIILNKYGKEAIVVNDNYIKAVIPFNEKVLEQQSVGLNVGLNLSSTEKDIINIILIDPNITSENIINVK